MSKSRADKVNPDATGLQKIFLKIRYHEQSRQWFAVLFVLLVSLLGEPQQNLLYAGAAIAAVGAAVRLWASGYVMKNKQLATTGPYSLVRHPLYVGNLLLLFGFSLAASVIWAFALMGFLVWLFYPVTIAYEDNKLHGIFGEEWEAWSQHIHALIPSFNGKVGSIKGEWSFKKSLMQNGEPVIVAYLIGCMYMLYIK